MRRRELILFIGGVPVATRSALAQQPAWTLVIGFLGIGSASGFSDGLTAFRDGLRSRGFVDGQNAVIEYRWAAGDAARLPALAAELVRARVDVIATSGGPLPGLAAENATRTIPIVSSSAAKVVASFARPGANVTGVANQTSELIGKRLELLHEAVPNAGVVGLLFNPANGRAAEMMSESEAAARLLGVHLDTVEARGEAEFDNAFARMAEAGAGACLVSPDPVFFSQHGKIIDLAARYKLPAIYEWREMAADGGLMAYGDSLVALYRRLGDYVGRILNGAKPADLPVEQPGVIQLVINLKTAKELGLTFPQTILARADEVIE